MRNVKALLFDLDGTLIDSADANYFAYRDALAEVGVALSPDYFRAVAFGRNWRQFLPELLGVADVAAAAVAERKRAIYPHYARAMRVNEALLSLARTSRPHMRTALVTTASTESLGAVSVRIDCASHFDTLVTGDDVARHKPAPDAYLLAAERLQIPPANCLAFEDSDTGVASVSAAGMMVVRVAF